jgi:transcriptional regulator with XRE-family HTH domain
MSYEYRRDSQKQIYDIRRVQAKIGQPIERSQVFGLRLKAARQRMGLPQDKFGVLLGLDEHTASARISRYENGIHEPPLRTAQLIATTLNVPLCYMYCEDNRLAELILKSNKFTEDQWGALDAFIKSISDQ